MPLRIDHTPQPSASGRRLWKAALVAGVALLLSLLLAEALLRGALDEEEANGNYWGRGAFVAHPEAGYQHAPRFRGRAVRRGVFAHPVNISAEGLRQDDVDAQLAHDRRVLILGDSFPFGLGVAGEESFPALLRPSLNASGIGVVNGAQTGYDVQQSLAWGRDLLPAVNPDVVLLTVFLANDLRDGYRGQHRRLEVVDGYRLRRDRWPRAPWIDFLRCRSYLWMQLDATINRLREKRIGARFHQAIRAHPDAVLAGTLDPLLALRRLTEGRGATFAVALIPRRGGPHELGTVFREQLTAAAIPWIDLAELRVDEHYIDGDGHWNAEGHRAASRLLLPWLQRLLASRPADTPQSS